MILQTVTFLQNLALQLTSLHFVHLRGNFLCIFSVALPSEVDRNTMSFIHGA